MGVEWFSVYRRFLSSSIPRKILPNRCSETVDKGFFLYDMVNLHKNFVKTLLFHRVCVII